MKAILVNDDRSLRWDDVPNPVLGEDDCLVKIEAAALNRADLMQREGDYPPPPGCPEWMGLEVSGTIVAMGDEARVKSLWKIGDKVCALLGGGGYARVHRLLDGRYMAAYARGDAIVARFATIDNLANWSEPTVVARGFTVSNAHGKIKVHLANAEFAQLKTGRIIYACNLRPQGWRHDIHPCGIAISLSDDAGKTCGKAGCVPADGVQMGVRGRISGNSQASGPVRNIPHQAG